MKHGKRYRCITRLPVARDFIDFFFDITIVATDQPADNMIHFSWCALNQRTDRIVRSSFTNMCIGKWMNFSCLDRDIQRTMDAFDLMTQVDKNRYKCRSIFVTLWMSRRIETTLMTTWVDLSLKAPNMSYKYEHETSQTLLKYHLDIILLETSYVQILDILFFKYKGSLSIHLT